MFEYFVQFYFCLFSTLPPTSWIFPFFEISTKAAFAKVAFDSVFSNWHSPAWKRVVSASPMCHFRCVIVCCVPGVLPLHKWRGILLPPGVFPGGGSEKWHSFSLVFLCMRPMNKCHSRAGAGGGSQSTPRCSWKHPTQKWQFENDTWERSGKNLCL